MGSRDTQAIVIECTRMVFTPYQCPDLGHTRQVCGIEAADGATTDNAHSLHRSIAASTWRAKRAILSNYLFTTFTCASNCPPSRRFSPRKILSPLLKESLIKMPRANNASCNAAEIVWIGAAPPSPMPFAPL